MVIGIKEGDFMQLVFKERDIEIVKSENSVEECTAISISSEEQNLQESEEVSNGEANTTNNGI